MRLFASFLSVLVLASSSASASDFVHQFYCGLLDQSPQQQVALRVSDDALESGYAEIFVSKMGAKGWEPFVHSTNAKVEFSWALFTRDGRTIDVIVGARIDLGRSGSITMETTENYDEDLFAPGRLKSNLRGLNYAKGVSTSYCTYLGGVPKPGVSGSN